MKSKELNKRAESLGGIYISQKGSHRKYRFTADGFPTTTVIIPQHTGDLPTGTARVITKALNAIEERQTS